MDFTSDLSRRLFLQQMLVASGGMAAVSLRPCPLRAGGGTEILDIGSRRELFLDKLLIGQLLGEARQELQHPVAREIVLRHEAPWEGTGSGYHSIFQDGDLYRMYYKAWHLDVTPKGVTTNRHPLYCCYAESHDGIKWQKPELGLHEFQGSKANNIVMTSGRLGPLSVDAGHPAVFQDDNPAAPAEGRYKAILRSAKPNGLLPFQSQDGLHWSPMTQTPILSGLGAFDSQNLAFWDPLIGKYRAYWRIFTPVTLTGQKTPTPIRAIRTATSDDLIHWGPPADLAYVDSPPEQLYTNQIKPYHRAPHILLGFPARYLERGGTQSMKDLPAYPERQMRSAGSPRYGFAITDSLLMSSRNGTLFHRWNEAFLRPGTERRESWNYGQQYLGWHLVETKTGLSETDRELSLYAVEGYWHGPGSLLRRYTLRLDGFVSIHGSARPGNELITRPLKFTGSGLHLNFATSAAGGLRIEIQQPDGSPIPGYTLTDSDVLFGDTVDRLATWKVCPNVQPLSSQPVRLRIELRDADLYSLQFIS